MKRIFMVIAILLCAFLVRMGDALAMKYRLEIDISFNNEQDAIDLMNYIEGIKDKTYKPTLTEKIPCHQKCRYHECYHDDPVPIQCGNYINVGFNKEKVIHKIKAER